MANAEKTAAVEELAGKFRDSSGAVLTEYRGLTVAQLSELRGSLKGNATFSVTKNTLTKIAAREAGLGDALESLLAGPSAIAFVEGDVAQAAKGLLDFAKAHPLLVIKGGKIEFRTDRHGNLHFIIGKASFPKKALLENYAAALDEVMRAKPSAAKGRYLKKVTFTTTMGPGIPVDPNKTRGLIQEEEATPAA